MGASKFFTRYFLERDKFFRAGGGGWELLWLLKIYFDPLLVLKTLFPTLSVYDFCTLFLFYFTLEKVLNFGSFEFIFIFFNRVDIPLISI